MLWRGFGIWFVDDLLAARFESEVLPKYLGSRGTWAQWNAIADPLVALRQCESATSPDMLPDVAMIDLDFSTRAAAEEFKTIKPHLIGWYVWGALNAKAKSLRKPEYEYQLYTGNPSSRDQVGFLTQTLPGMLDTKPIIRVFEKAEVTGEDVIEWAEAVCRQLAERLLRRGDISIPHGMSDFFREHAASVDGALALRRAAKERFAKEVKPEVESAVRQCREAALIRGVEGELRSGPVLDADTPNGLDLKLKEWKGPLGDLARQQLAPTLGQTREWWETEERRTASIAESVWRSLDQHESHRGVWRVMPFAGQRLSSSAGSAILIESMASDIDGIRRLLEENTDHAWALVRLFKLVTLGSTQYLESEHSPAKPIPTTAFAHARHGWKDRQAFELQFGFVQPDSAEAREELLEAEISGARRDSPLYGHVKRIPLPDPTVRRIREDAERCTGGVRAMSLSAFCQSDGSRTHWCVEPDKYFAEHGAEALRSAPVHLHIPPNERVLSTRQVLTDWRQLAGEDGLLGKLMADTPGAVTSVKIDYSDDGRTLDLTVDIALRSYLGPINPRSGGGVGTALRMGLGWCQIVAESNGQGATEIECYRVEIPGYVHEPPCVAKRREPYLQVTLQLPHYNNTRSIA